MTARETIINNPYRVLGLYVGDSPAKESSHRSRLTAFAKVGKSLELPMPYDDVLGVPERTVKAIADASQALSLPDDRIRYALLWVSDSAEPWAAHLNGAVKALIDNDVAKAVLYYKTLISDDTERAAFVSAATHGLKPMGSMHLDQLLVDLSQPQSRKLKEYLLSSEEADIAGCYSVQVDLITEKFINNTSQRAKDGDIKAITTDFTDVLSRIVSLMHEAKADIENLGVDAHDRYQKLACQVADDIYSQALVVLSIIDRWVWDIKLPDNKMGKSSLKAHTILMVDKLLYDIDKAVNAAVGDMGLQLHDNEQLSANRRDFIEEIDRQRQCVKNYFGPMNSRYILDILPTLLMLLGSVASIVFVITMFVRCLLKIL